MDFDGVLRLNVQPLLNSKHYRLANSNSDNTTLVGKDKVINNDLINSIKTKITTKENIFIITKNNKIKFDDLDDKIKEIINDDKHLIVSSATDKSVSINSNKITHYFDDSNSNIFEILEKKPPTLQKLYKVFPETIFDLYDNLDIVGTSFTNTVKPKQKPLGTLNTLMVEINKDVKNENKIKVVTYNIKHDLKEQDELKNVHAILKEYMETNIVDFICLQEFGYFDDKINATYKDETQNILDTDKTTEIMKYDEKKFDEQTEKNHPLHKLNDENNKLIKSETLNKYKYIYNFQSKENQFTFYNSEKYEIVKDDKDDKNELIIRGNTDLYGRPFTLIVFKNKSTNQNLILINAHFPQKLNDKGVVKYNDMINNFMVSYINNVEYVASKTYDKDKTKHNIPELEFNSIKNAIVKDKVKEYIKNTRIIMAGDFNRTIYSNSIRKEFYSNNPESQSGVIKGFEIDNSAYGLKLFKGLFSEDKDKNKSVIMYNIPPEENTFKKSTIGVGGKHIDNVLDSFGLQETYQYNETPNASDHTSVLVTLLDATPIYDLNDLKFNDVSDISDISGVNAINYCYP